MQSTPYIWKDGKLIDWDDATVHILTHSLHYGAAVFEGVRCYKTPKGTAIFRLKEHTERLLYSAEAIAMDVPYSLEELMDATVLTVKENKLEAGYIRPLLHYGYGKMGLNPDGAPTVCSISCWPWGKYLAHDAVDVKIVNTIRIHPGSTRHDAKITGHYVNSIMAVLELRGTKYHEALLMDHEGNIAEGPGENLFIVKDGIFYTPKTGNVLPGITRSTVMEMLAGQGHEVQEKVLTREDVLAADEAFFTGTAAEVTGINSIDDHVFGEGGMGPMASKVKSDYMKIVNGEDPAFEKYLTVV
jgi:branched-chain amino acid aminotransferase